MINHEAYEIYPLISLSNQVESVAAYGMYYISCNILNITYT